VLAVDLGFVALALACVRATKAWLVLAPVVVTLLHFGVERGVVAAPRTTLGWGLLQVVGGFAVLFACVCATLWLRLRASDRSLGGAHRRAPTAGSR
jgi:hypothetical protein